MQYWGPEAEGGTGDLRERGAGFGGTGAQSKFQYLQVSGLVTDG